MVDKEITQNNHERIKLLIKNLDNNILPIESITKSRIGWTNEVYFVKTLDNIFVVKFFSNLHSDVRQLEIKVMNLVKDYIPKIYLTDCNTFLVQEYINITNENIFSLETLCKGELMTKIFDFLVSINSIDQTQLNEHDLITINMENFYVKYSKGALDHIKKNFLSRSKDDTFSNELFQQYQYVYKILSTLDYDELFKKQQNEIMVVNHFDLHKDNVLIEDSNLDKKKFKIFIIDFENMIYGYIGLDIIYALLIEATNTLKEWNLLLIDKRFYNTYKSYIDFFLENTTNFTVKMSIQNSKEYFMSIERFCMLIKIACSLILAFQGNFYNDNDPGYIARNASIAKLLYFLLNN